MNTHKCQPDHSLPQSVERNDAPEVVVNAVLRAPLERHSSLTRPEPYNAPSQQPAKTFNDFYSRLTGSQTESRQFFDSLPNYEDNVAKQRQADKRHADADADANRTFGVSRRLCWLVLTVVIVLIVVAAVLGGVLGSILTQRDHDNAESIPPPVVAFANSGVSLIVPAESSVESSATYAYYQDSNSNLVELALSNNTMRAAGNDMVIAFASEGPQAVTMAAISYKSSDEDTIRQVFYIDLDGSLMTTQTSSGLNWSTPYNVILDGDTADTSSPALAVCSGTAQHNNGLNGIRVYHGSTTCPFTNYTQCISEVGLDFAESTLSPTWHLWAVFGGSDVESGVACTLSSSVNHLYPRNSTSGQLAQWQWDYVKAYEGNTLTWTMNATLTGPSNIASGFDVAACTDDSDDYIFYQNANGAIIRTWGTSSQILGTLALDTSTVGAKLSAAYSNGSATVIYQRSGNTSLSYVETAEGDAVAGSGLVVE